VKIRSAFLREVAKRQRDKQMAPKHNLRGEGSNEMRNGDCSILDKQGEKLLAAVVVIIIVFFFFFIIV